MKKSVKNVLILLGVLAFCLTFSLALLLARPNAIADTPVRTKTFADYNVSAVSVLDIDGVMKMTAINYLPNEFAELDQAVSDANQGDEPAKRGTYRFYIDTLSIEEWAQSDRLNALLKPDGNWHLTMYIPPVFAACSVFVQYQNKEYVGSIDRYNIDYYINYSSPSQFDDTVSHETAIKPLFIDIPIAADSKFSRECIVTIHYEANNDNFVGFLGPVLIGEDAAIRNVVNQNRPVILIGAILSAATLLLFLLICILKRSFPFVPQLMYAVGVFAMLFSTYSLFGYTTVPYLILGLRRFSLGLILFASAMYLPKKVGKIPVLYLTSAAAIVATILAFVSPFCTSAAAYLSVCFAYLVLVFTCIVVILAFAIRDMYHNKPLGLRLNTMISSVLVVMALFANQPIPFVMFSPAFWLSIGELLVTLVLGLSEFVSAEVHNRYLTTNLEKEVARQTQSLQNVIAERDKILLYISHDMKKTVAGMGDSLTDLRQKLSADTPPELTADVDRLLQKNNELKKDFIDLSKYGKQNYVAEQSEEVDLCRIVQSVTDDLRPDCEANGIILTVTLPETLMVYAKKVALESVIYNLVLNAIEHSFCSHLYVTAAKRKDMCRLEVIDDGQGITTDKNVFAPFVSGNQSENNSGLGLFLAKNAIETMHGELTYERKDNYTVFSATLPPA